MKNTKTKEDFIVQNVTPGYHFVSDLKLNIGPLEVVDLTHKDYEEVQSSQNLRDSLRAGFLRKISRVEADQDAAYRTAKMRKEVTKLQKNAETASVQFGEKTLDVEPVNIGREDAPKYAEQVTTAGYANDQLSFVVALEIAQGQAEARGETLSVREFHDRVSRDSNLVRRLIENNTNAVRESADSRVDSAAYFASPSDSGGSKVDRVRMTPPDTMIDMDHSDAEGIDLTKDL